MPLLDSTIELHGNAELDKLLLEFDKGGGVLDIIAARCEKVPDAARHREAAVDAMKYLAEEVEAYGRRNSRRLNLSEDEFYRITVDEKKLEGRTVSLEEFWGGDRVGRENVTATSWTTPSVDGYKTAFFLPPYGIDCSEVRHLKVFNAINSKILGAAPERCSIFSWSTDWSNYFDAGHEWWGAFYWTVYSPQTQLITAIGASSTD